MIYLNTGIAMIALGIALIVYICNIPIVQYSHATNECVNVIGIGSCEDIPAMHFSEWVE
jgi:hypothetical protein